MWFLVLPFPFFFFFNFSIVSTEIPICLIIKTITSFTSLDIFVIAALKSLFSMSAKWATSGSV